MMPADMVRQGVRAYNAEFTLRAWAALAVGAVTSLFTYAAVMLVSMLVFYGSPVPWTLIGTAIFAVFMGAAWWAARRGSDPMGEATEMDEGDIGGMKVAALFTGIRVSPRHTVAVLAGLFIHGPASIIEARSMLSSRLPVDAATLHAAAAVLERLLKEQDVAFAEIEPKTAALVLVRVGLAKPDAKGSLANLVATVKAREEAGH